MPELIKARRQARVLVVVCLALAAFASYGWLRSPSETTRSSRRHSKFAALEANLSTGGHNQRIRTLHRLVRAGGTQAVAAVIETLRSARSDRVRLVAIEQLGKLATDEAVRELAAVADSGSLPLRRQAIAALGVAGSPKAIDQLVELLSSAGSSAGLAGKLRTDILAALGRAGGERAATQLAALARDTHEPERKAAIRALGRTGSKSAFATLDALTRDSDADARKTAISALGTLGSPAAKQRLIALARRGPLTERALAVGALGSFSDTEVQVLLASLVQDPEASIAQAALRALGGSDAPLARQALQGALSHAQPKLRLAAATALAKAGQPEGRQALLALVGDGNQGYVAASELAQLKDPEARQSLLALAQQGSRHAQSNVLSALSQLKGPDVERTLDQLRRNASPQVAARALEELARRRGKRALPLLQQAFNEGSLQVRRSALSAMAKLKDPSTRDLLIKTAANTQDYGLRYAAIRGLADAGGPEARKALLGLLKTGDRNLSASVAYQLANLGGADVRDALLEKLKTGDSSAYAVTYALGRMQDPQTRQRMREMLDDPTLKGSVKTQLVSALGHQSDGEGLLAAAAHPDAAIRAAALGQLGSVGGPAAEQALIDAVGGGDKDAKQAALRGLKTLGTPRAVQSMGQALHDKDTFHLAVNGLASNGSKPAIQALADRYRSGDGNDRQTIINTLGYAMGSTEARQIVLTALDDSNDGVAASAAGMLARGGGASSQGRLVSLLQSSPSKAVRYAIASQLRWSGRPIYTQHKALIDAIYSKGG